MHRSPYHGFSIEFAEHREYAPGDDLRYVDWKVFGKTDKFYLKQYEEETNLVCYLLLDTSESMQYQSAARAAVEARVRPVRGRGAGVPGAAAAGQRRPGDVRPGNPPARPAQQQPVAAQAAAARDGADDGRRARRAPGRSFTTWPSGSSGAASSSILSDLFDDVESMLAGLKHFRHRRHEVIVLHVLDPAELDFPFQHVTLFKGSKRWATW